MARGTLDDLFFGDLHPHEDDTLDPKEVKAAEYRVSRCEGKLRDTFTDEQKELFEKYLDEIADLKALRELSAFKKGFGLGMQLTAEGMRSGKPDD
ncbi:MAG: hypothetical protein IJW00_06795 [Clostridia bacterium]|nr:hypothetical protein [Clostridia bacterium]